MFSKFGYLSDSFFDLFKEFLGDKELNFDDFWKKAAFTNYVQHELGNRTDTQASDCKEEYLLMFEDVLSKLPQMLDVVITWGSKIDKELKKKKESDKYPNFENTYNTILFYFGTISYCKDDKNIRTICLFLHSFSTEIKKNGVIC